MARGVDGLDRPSVSGHDLAVGQADVRLNAVSMASSTTRSSSGSTAPCGPKASVGAPVSSCSQAASGEWSAWQWVTRMWVTCSPASAAVKGVAMGVEDRPGIDDGHPALPDQVGAGTAIGELGRVLGHHPPDEGAHLLDSAVADVERGDEGDVAIGRAGQPGRAARRAARRRRPGSRRQPRSGFPPARASARRRMRRGPGGGSARSGGSRSPRASDPTRPGRPGPWRRPAGRGRRPPGPAWRRRRWPPRRPRPGGARACER